MFILEPYGEASYIPYKEEVSLDDIKQGMCVCISVNEVEKFRHEVARFQVHLLHESGKLSHREFSILKRKYFDLIKTHLEKVRDDKDISVKEHANYYKILKSVY